MSNSNRIGTAAFAATLVMLALAMTAPMASAFVLPEERLPASKVTKKPVKSPLKGAMLNVGDLLLVGAASDSALGDALLETLPWKGLAECVPGVAPVKATSKAAARKRVTVVNVASRGDGALLVAGVVSPKGGLPKACVRDALKETPLPESVRGKALVAFAVVKRVEVMSTGRKALLLKARGPIGPESPVARWLTFAVEDCVHSVSSAKDVEVMADVVGTEVVALRPLETSKYPRFATCLRERVPDRAESPDPASVKPAHLTFHIVRLFELGPGADPRDVAGVALKLVAAKGPPAKKAGEHVGSKGVLAIIGTVDSGDGAVVDVLSDGTSADLDGAFAGVSGVAVAAAPEAELRVTIVTVRTSGAVDSKEATEVLKRRMAALRLCYEREVRKSGAFSGKLRADWTVGEKGRVTAALTAMEEGGHESTADCFNARILAWRFPDPGEAGPSRVNATFELGPAKSSK